MTEISENQVAKEYKNKNKASDLIQSVLGKNLYSNLYSKFGANSKLGA